MKVKARERFKIGYSITKQQIEMSEKKIFRTWSILPHYLFFIYLEVIFQF